ncbi:Uncharacterised protein [Plesiomonas shigelloides]|nr:Uncharacterised protein [Plesiomonas shigelloides]
MQNEFAKVTVIDFVDYLYQCFSRCVRQHEMKPPS